MNFTARVVAMLLQLDEFISARPSPFSRMLLDEADDFFGPHLFSKQRWRRGSALIVALVCALTLVNYFSPAARGAEAPSSAVDQLVFISYWALGIIIGLHLCYSFDMWMFAAAQRRHPLWSLATAAADMLVSPILFAMSLMFAMFLRVYPHVVDIIENGKTTFEMPGVAFSLVGYSVFSGLLGLLQFPSAFAFLFVCSRCADALIPWLEIPKLIEDFRRHPNMVLPICFGLFSALGTFLIILWWLVQWWLLAMTKGLPWVDPSLLPFPSS
jgi:hypothetical protein